MKTNATVTTYISAYNFNWVHCYACIMLPMYLDLSLQLQLTALIPHHGHTSLKEVLSNFRRISQSFCMEQTHI